MGLFKQEELISREEITLIDFLYKDMDLINSFYSQIFGGDIQNIVKSEITVDETTNKTDIGVPGTLGLKNQSRTSSDTSVSENFNPHDYKVIKLLECLNLSISDISSAPIGKLIAIKGNLIFRNYESLNKLLPFMGDNNLIPGFNNPIDSNNKSKKSPTIGKIMTQMFKMIPYGLEFEVTTSNNENAICILKDDYLTVNSNDLLRAYGTNIPDEWTIIGIIDSPVKLPRKSSNVFKSSIDEATNAFASMALDTDSAILRPIAIYRKLTA